MEFGKRATTEIPFEDADALIESGLAELCGDPECGSLHPVNKSPAGQAECNRFLRRLELLRELAKGRPN